MATLPQGFLVRPPTMDDAESLVSLLTANVNSVNYIGYTLKDLYAHWATPGFHKETDAWVVVTPENQRVGYAFVQGEKERISIVCQHIDYRGQDIWCFLFEYVEERVRHSRSPLLTQTHVTLSTAFNDANASAKHGMEQKGYQMVHRAWLMKREMSGRPLTPQLPKGMTIRTFIPGRDEHLAHEVMQDAFMLSEAFEEWEPKFTEDIFDPTLWFFALNGNEVAGAILCYNNDPNMGWVWSLGVRQAYRQRGFGKVLLQYAFAEFYKRGQYTVGLDVNAENPTAIQLYCNAGMHRVQEFYTYQKEIL